MQADIAKAEKVEQGDYTDASFAELIKAIESAKKLTSFSSKTDIDNARATIAKAIEELTVKLIGKTITGTIKVSDVQM